MSHFTVLVVTDKPEDLEKALQPFHEYECTGTKDEHVVWVDEHDNYLEEFKKDTRTMLVNESGEKVSPYDDQFYREPTEDELGEIGIGGSGCTKNFNYSSRDWDDGRGYRAKIKFIPDGYEEKEFPMSEIYSFEEYMKDWNEYGEDNIQDGRYGRYTNPNAQWDWWTIGGRWSGLLKPKNPDIGMKGEKGLMGSEFDAKGVDQCIKSNVDFEGRMKEAAFEAEKEYRQAHIIMDGRTFKPWSECYEEFEDIQDARDFYHGQDVVKDLKKVFDSFYDTLEDYLKSREDFVSMKANSSISTFAVLKDGQWYERGDMGWFGCVSDEKDQNDWNGEFKDLIDTIPDDKCLTIVDCHI